MPAESIPFLPAVLSPVLAWLLASYNRSRDVAKQGRTEFINALEALSTAATETRAYLADQDEGTAGDREREVKLANLWNTAAIRVRAFDSHLADTCGIKGDYWVNPKAFERDRHWEEYRIDINRVIAEIDAVRKQYEKVR